MSHSDERSISEEISPAVERTLWRCSRGCQKSRGDETLGTSWRSGLLHSATKCFTVKVIRHQTMLEVAVSAPLEEEMSSAARSRWWWQNRCLTHTSYILDDETCDKTDVEQAFCSWCGPTCRQVHSCAKQWHMVMQSILVLNKSALCALYIT